MATDAVGVEVAGRVEPCQGFPAVGVAALLPDVVGLFMARFALLGADELAERLALRMAYGADAETGQSFLS